MRKPGGYATLFGPAGLKECDTITCCHCNRIVHLPPKAQVDWCRNCMKAVCPSCGGKDCTPFEKVLERMESRRRICEAI